MQSSWWIAKMSVALVVASAWGCASDTEGSEKKDENPTPASGGSSFTSTGGAGGDSGSVATGGQSTGGVASVTPNVLLPFAVDDYYVPSGFMGREDPGGAIEVEGISMELDACPERAPAAQGECHTIVYTPQMLDPMAMSTWAGVFWQFPEANWGELQGEAVEQGATKIVFTAWAEVDGQVVEFMSGGIGDAGTSYQDTFKVQQFITLSDSPQEFELNLSTSTYTYVLAAFGWVIATDSEDPVTFYVDDIRWVK